jgi:hypothetical protein
MKHPTRPPIAGSALVALCLCVSGGAWAQWLVTPEEAAASLAAPPPLVMRSMPVAGAPVISVLSPNLTAPVPSPTRIQVRFEPAAPATIRPETFRVRYGSLRIDITGRITSASTITPEGIDVSQASLPKGSHRLFIEVQDSAGRSGERQVQFTVE